MSDARKVMSGSTYVVYTLLVQLAPKSKKIKSTDLLQMTNYNDKRTILRALKWLEAHYYIERNYRQGLPAEITLLKADDVLGT